jgi:glycosyltransferase involved in cell wall biosynthesis
MTRAKKSYPRILYVTSFWPGASGIGAEVRASQVLRALQQRGSVEVVMVSDSGEAPRNPSPDFTVAQHLELNPERNRNLADKLRWTFDPRKDYPNGYGVSRDATQSVLRHAAEFDLIWFFKLRSADSFPRQTWERSVVDIDDIQSAYEHASLPLAQGARARLMIRHREFSWRRREKLLGERFNVLAVCSGEDRQYLKELGVQAPVHVIPNGFDKPAQEPVRVLAAPPRIGFIGLFDYFPNQEGMQWFAKECWPRIEREVPGVRLRLVGRGSDGPLKPGGANIDGLGWLDDPAAEIGTWSAMITPIRVGGGTRVKIAQGFSSKCPVVSTSLGAHGYQPIDGETMYVADTAEAFANACVKTIRDPDAAAQMADRAWKQFLEKWTWEAIRPRVWAAAEDCMGRSPSAQTRTAFTPGRSGIVEGQKATP